MLKRNAARNPYRQAQNAIYPRKDIALMLPALLGFLGLYVLPLGVSVYHALIKSPFDSTFVGLDNFRAVAQNTYYQLALKNSLILTAFLPVFTVLPALALALAMQQYPWLRSMQGVFLFSAFMPSAAVASIWQLFFAKGRGFVIALSYSNGMLNTGLNGEWLSLFTLALWKNIGIPLVLILGALLATDKELEQAAALDGAGVFRRFVRIVFPQIKPAVLFAVIYVMMCSQRLYREAYVLYGAYPGNSVYLVQHYMNNHFAKLNYQNLSSGAMMLVLVIAVMIVPLFRLMRHYNEERS